MQVISHHHLKTGPTLVGDIPEAGAVQILKGYLGRIVYLAFGAGSGREGDRNERSLSAAASRNKERQLRIWNRLGTLAW